MKQIADLGQKQIRARMATVLLIIADLIGKNYIDIHISRNELSEYAGISTGSAIRLLSDLEKEGIYAHCPFFEKTDAGCRFAGVENFGFGASNCLNILVG